jgi:hypothetical protein
LEEVGGYNILKSVPLMYIFQYLLSTYFSTFTIHEE